MLEFDDKPINSPKKDLFGFDPLAKAIADSILKMTAPEGTVIAINGPWGSGKSSLINLIRNHLGDAAGLENTTGILSRLINLVRHRLCNTPDKDDLKIVNFKCWWFRGEEALTIEFFRALYSAMKPKLSGNAKKVILKLVPQLLIGASPVIDSATGMPGSTLIAAKGVSNFIKQAETVEKLHMEISAALRKNPRRYLIIIDDIDRLSPDEAMLIFRLVKSVGGLPNVMYLLAYDRLIAEKIVAERYPSEGPHYLEKIVQASFDLPEPTKLVLRNEYLDRAFPSIIESKYPVIAKRFNPLFDAIIAPEMKTPRDLLKILNPLLVTWSAVKGHVDVADFLCIETLRVKRPWLYHALRANKAELTKITPSTSLTVGGHPHAERFEHIFLEREFKAEKREFAAERERLRQGLMLLFPALADIWSPNDREYDSPDVWDEQCRVCASKHFDTYFRFARLDHE